MFNSKPSTKKKQTENNQSFGLIHQNNEYWLSRRLFTSRSFTISSSDYSYLPKK
ncbi:hypothetical protein BACFIN_06192 [Bacteroides finegoldii DSM 17565]|nr:hypothetical protein BACFIN_06192 [Bacteroides finegoldii DSM 17565]